jgi:PHD/YefM family antitoxin component YafN of YafNO toxin-antitoxin module
MMKNGTLHRVSVAEVKDSWEQVIQRILQCHEPTLVEEEGFPAIVILSATDYEQLVAQQNVEARRQQQLALLDQAEQFAQEVAARYTLPSPDSVDILLEIRAEHDDKLLGLC